MSAFETLHKPLIGEKTMISDERAMIHLTERAATAANGLLTAYRIPASHGLRLVRGDDGTLMLVIDAPRRGDAVLHCLWAPVLIADEQIVAAIAGGALDLVADTERVTFPSFCLRLITAIEAGIDDSFQPVRLALGGDDNGLDNQRDPDEHSASSDWRADTNRVLASAIAD